MLLIFDIQDRNLETQFMLGFSLLYEIVADIHLWLTGLDTKYQPWTQQKKILVFDFIASNELTIHMDSLNGQIFPPCPPTGSGGPI